MGEKRAIPGLAGVRKEVQKKRRKRKRSETHVDHWLLTHFRTRKAVAILHPLRLIPVALKARNAAGEAAKRPEGGIDGQQDGVADVPLLPPHRPLGHHHQAIIQGAGEAMMNPCHSRC